MRARDTQYASPFATNAQKEGLVYNGGKLDDITVVVSRVCRVPRLPVSPLPPRPGVCLCARPGVCLLCVCAMSMRMYI